MMANRLSKIVTRTGDDGTTGLADGSRVTKDSARIQIIGTLDELNSHLGLLLAEGLPPDLHDILLETQNDLFDLGAALAYPPALFPENKLTRLDETIVRYNADLPPLKDFVLPGGSRAGALCHIARTVARRAERDWVALAQREATPIHGLAYLNRLSDLLFVLSRVINRVTGETEAIWQKK